MSLRLTAQPAPTKHPHDSVVHPIWPETSVMRLDARRLSSAGNCERGLPGSAWASGPARPEHRVAFATNAESVRSVRRSNCQDLWIMFSGRVGEVSKEQGAVVVRDQASGADRGLHGVVRVPRVGPWRIMSIDPAVVA